MNREADGFGNSAVNVPLGHPAKVNVHNDPYLVIP